MRAWHWAGLIVPLLGLAELVGHRYYAARAPSLEEWQGAKAAILEMRQHGELVTVAPRWAEPVARNVLGTSAFPLAQVARPDETAFSRALEISILGEVDPGLAAWRTVETLQQGKFQLRLLENPSPAQVRFDFVEGLNPDRAQTWLDLGTNRIPCPYTEVAPPRAGGLHGHTAFPAHRFACPNAEHLFAGVTVIDDQDYRPRRCIWSHPPDGSDLVIRYSNVPLGQVIRGYGGLSWFLMRDGVGTPIDLEIRIGEDRLGVIRHQDQEGWSRFEVSTGRHQGTRADVEFRIRSQNSFERHFCFQADTR